LGALPTRWQLTIGCVANFFELVQASALAASLRLRGVSRRGDTLQQPRIATLARLNAVPRTSHVDGRISNVGASHSDNRASAIFCIACSCGIAGSPEVLADD